MLVSACEQLNNRVKRDPQRWQLVGLTFQELLHERLGPPYWLLAQYSENMRLLLPAIHYLLVVLPSLVQQQVDHGEVLYISVLLELFPDTQADELGGNVETVERYNFGRLENTGSIEGSFNSLDEKRRLTERYHSR